LFWSHGVDCVGVSNATPLTDRETYFSELPEPESPYAVFYGRGNWAPVDYYKGRGEYRTFDFSAANLARKYGPDWRSEHADMAHRRLRSWGMNTIANWSDRDIYQQRKTPYVTTISAGSRTIEGSEGYWGKFFDVFDPDFRRSLGRAMESRKAVPSMIPGASVFLFTTNYRGAMIPRCRWRYWPVRPISPPSRRLSKCSRKNIPPSTHSIRRGRHAMLRGRRCLTVPGSPTKKKPATT
jgi:hypothetical protein